MSWRLRVREIKTSLKNAAGGVFDAIKIAMALEDDDSFQSHLREEGIPFEVFFEDTFRAGTGHSFGALASSLRHFPKRSDWTRLGVGEVLMQAWELDHPKRKSSQRDPIETLKQRILGLPKGKRRKLLRELLRELGPEEIEAIFPDEVSA